MFGTGWKHGTASKTIKHVVKAHVRKNGVQVKRHVRKQKQSALKAFLPKGVNSWSSFAHYCFYGHPPRKYYSQGRKDEHRRK